MCVVIAQRADPPARVQKNNAAAAQADVASANYQLAGQPVQTFGLPINNPRSSFSVSSTTGLQSLGIMRDSAALPSRHRNNSALRLGSQVHA